MIGNSSRTLICEDKAKLVLLIGSIVIGLTSGEPSGEGGGNNEGERNSFRFKLVDKMHGNWTKTLTKTFPTERRTKILAFAIWTIAVTPVMQGQFKSPANIKPTCAEPTSEDWAPNATKLKPRDKTKSLSSLALTKLSNWHENGSWITSAAPRVANFSKAPLSSGEQMLATETVKLGTADAQSINVNAFASSIGSTNRLDPPSTFAMTFAVVRNFNDAFISRSNGLFAKWSFSIETSSSRMPNESNCKLNWR